VSRRIVLLGAGSAAFTTKLVADFIRSGSSWELGLVDISEENLEVARRLVTRMVSETGACIQVSASTERRELLPGADFVVSTVAVGGRRAWESDVFVPREFGIYQPVGDSVMPGGVSRALRQVPVLVAIAEDIADLCPHAWFFNYANPMTANCRAVRKSTPVKVVGLCHGVFGVERTLARFIGVDHRDVESVAVGVNHLTWLLQFRWRGLSAWPLVRRQIAAQSGIPFGGAIGSEYDEAGMLERSGSVDDSPFSWDLYQLYGAFPAVLDRHVTEFFPETCRKDAYYGKTLGVDAFSFEGTIENGDRNFARMQQMAFEDATLPEGLLEGGTGEHEQLLDIIGSLLENRPRAYSVNLPNEGQVRNLPEEAVLECPALVNSSGFHPLGLGDIPTGIASTLVRRLASQELTVDAALTGSVDLFVQALLADGAVAVPEEARRLASALLEAQKEHLPAFAESLQEG